MPKQFRLPRQLKESILKRAGPIAAALAAALVLVPAASPGTYGDAAGDSGVAGDITGVSVVSDKLTGQIVFRITGTNLATSVVNDLEITIDSDANPLTGDLTDHGTDYWFGMSDRSYGFQHWNGSDWVDTPDLSVHITADTSQIIVSVNRSELGNSSDFNFIVSTYFLGGLGKDLAPNDGAFNYSVDTDGPQIDSVDVQTSPSAGPKAGKRFLVKPTGLRLPLDGRASTTPLAPDSYSCSAKLGTSALPGSGIGRCAYAIPRRARGKRLTVVLTVSYEGATKRVPLAFKVG